MWVRGAEASVVDPAVEMAALEYQRFPGVFVSGNRRLKPLMAQPAWEGQLFLPCSLGFGGTCPGAVPIPVAI